MERLNGTLGHRPVSTTEKLDCVVCSEHRQKLGLPRQGNRHEARQKCSHCPL